MRGADRGAEALLVARQDGGEEVSEASFESNRGQLLCLVVAVDLQAKAGDAK